MPVLKGADCKAWAGYEDESVFALNDYYHEKGISQMKEDEISAVRKSAQLQKTAYLQGLLDAYAQVREATGSELFDFPFKPGEYLEGIDETCEEKSNGGITVVAVLAKINETMKRK